MRKLFMNSLILQNEGLDDIVIERLGLNCNGTKLEDWSKMVQTIKNPKDKVNIALVGKYVELKDAYMSVAEALFHAGIPYQLDVNISWISSEKVNDENADELFKDIQGILVPGGFGDRGIDGKIAAIKYAREKKIPFLGICLGMQLAVVEFARNVLKYKDAHSVEFDENTPYPVIDLLPEQKEVVDLGGTMRLGKYPCLLKEGTKAIRLMVA